MDTEKRLSISARYHALMIVKNFFTENTTKLSRAKKTSKKQKNSRK